MAFPASEDLIVAAERELGIRFPPGLRARLARNNGGDVECLDDYWELHPVQDVGDRRRAARTASHVVNLTHAVRTWSGFPVDAVAIATGADGDLLILRGDGAGVEHWSHETHECVAVDVNWDADLRRPGRG